MIDTLLKTLENNEMDRLNNDIELIASENYPSQDILDLLGSYFSVKYAEGFPREVSKQGRHYAGCENIDLLEIYAIAKAKELFNVKYANVQPHSGSQANQAVYAGLLKPGDTILSMSIEAGGHLTHGAKASATSKYYNFVHYGLDDDGDLDYEDIKEKLVLNHPHLLLVGASAFSKKINYKYIRDLVDVYNLGRDDETKCYLMSDSAHVMGFIAAHIWEDEYDPTKWCDVITSTTHKTLRGPRGGLILWNDEKLCSKINSGVFPKIQGGPNEAIIAAKAQCFIEALKPEYKEYMKNVAENMQALINGIISYDRELKISFVGGFSENHMIMLDLRGTDINGKEAEELLSEYNIICNKNMMPGDSKPSESSAIRIGTPAITTRGFNKDMCFDLGRLIARIILNAKRQVCDTTIDFEEEYIRNTVKKMLEKVGPFYKNKITLQNDNIIA